MMKISQGESLYDDSQESSFLYGKVYEKENDRLKIATDENQIGILINLVDCLNPPFYVLYVLIVSRLGNKIGRYQSSLFESKEELFSFLNEYKLYLETDARHHLWIGAIDNSGLLVYDQHNVVYAYGNIDEYKNILNENNYIMKSFDFPTPHSHYYHPENDIYEERILSALDWQYFPLEETDDWSD